MASYFALSGVSRQANVDEARVKQSPHCGEIASSGQNPPRNDIQIKTKTRHMLRNVTGDG
jgi:hypothetical protein